MIKEKNNNNNTKQRCKEAQKYPRRDGKIRPLATQSNKNTYILQRMREREFHYNKRELFSDPMPLPLRRFFIFNSLNKSQRVTLKVDSELIPVYCHLGDFGCGTGGWTPVMKIDGNKV